MPSSKPYQRSPKKKWPLISPASSASVSRIFALTSECPVFHISGLPPWRRMWPGRRPVHLTSNRIRSEEHTSELQSLMRISYAVFCLKKKKKQTQRNQNDEHQNDKYIEANHTNPRSTT